MESKCCKAGISVSEVDGQNWQCGKCGLPCLAQDEREKGVYHAPTKSVPLNEEKTIDDELHTYVPEKTASNYVSWNTGKKEDQEKEWSCQCYGCTTGQLCTKEKLVDKSTFTIKECEHSFEVLHYDVISVSFYCKKCAEVRSKEIK